MAGSQVRYVLAAKLVNELRVHLFWLDKCVGGPDGADLRRVSRI